ncbi:Calcineurin-binding protein cabin-1 [Nymphon striatum]|nr:Calcineurin-binding protein cabin-1 [Nymphon striatum]
MIRITALNEEPSGNSSGSQDLELITKEAQEEEALELYNKALELQRIETFDEAESLFMTLLDTELLSRATPSDDLQELLQPSLRMKYSTFKNLASIYLHRNENSKAMKYLLEAAEIDDSDVSLWFKVGTVAMKIVNYPLARLAFEEGLRCNENHWPCLDNLITILYVLNDYASCLNNIAKGLKRENGFLKGLAFRDAIFKEHAGLKLDIHQFFSDCDILDLKEEYDSEIGQKLIDDALEMRQKKRDRSKPSPRPVLTLQQPLKSHTWKNLGERLCELYNFVKNSPLPMTPGCRVDLSENTNASQCPIAGNIPDSESSPSSSMSQTPLTQPLLVTMSASPQVITPSGPTSPSQHSSLLITSQSTPITINNDFCFIGFELTDTDNDMNQSGEYTDDAGLLKRASKRKRQKDEIADLAAKRRSTRVRNIIKKPQLENVNYFELLQDFLPAEFCCQEDEYENCTTPSVECDNHITNDHHYGHSGFQIDCSPRPIDCTEFQSTEEADIKQFLLNHQYGHTLIYILYCYLTDLSSKSHHQWPPGLDEIYMSVYIKARKHFEHPSVMFQEEDNEFIKKEAMMALTYNEFKMEKWQTSKPRPSISPILSPRNQLIVMLGPNFPGTYFLNDVDFLLQASTSKDIFNEFLPNISLRVLWLHARYQILQGDSERALSDFNQMKNYIDAFEAQDKITVPNCVADNLITLENVQRQMDSIRRCQSLEEVQRLYDQQSYQEVVNLLFPTFSEKQQLKHKVSSDIPERHAQLLLLQNSLSQLQDYRKCVEWGEKALNEALQQYTIVSGLTARTDWGNTMTQLLESLESCLKKDIETVSCLPMKQLKRLCQNLIKIISLQMNGPDPCSETCINTMLPWILLYRLVQYNETKFDDKKTKAETSTEEVENAESFNSTDEVKCPMLSLKLLYTAHDCLGRRSWCCCFDGDFLLTMAQILLDELHVKFSWINPHPHRIEIENNLEQCFYCLYGHPSKKTKAKHLQEHGSPQIALTWERAKVVFEYFKPFEVPEFDSYKTSTISGDVENLLRRIVVLVPTHKNPKNTPDTVMAYIEGSTEHYPVESNNQDQNKIYPFFDFRPIINELYYLLADYYFKNKEQGKAIKFYILDICVNPNHMDSWAGMALARSSQIEQKLNSNELKSDGPIFRKASATLHCFKRAVEIDRTNLALWIEYGSLAYQMQAHSSRQLKQKEQLVLNPDIVEMLKDKKKEMLETAYHCFKTASEFTDENGVEEKWLHHYMLGKISEKKYMMEPKHYLTQYEQASMHLHKEGARYPKKINYHNPPYLSLESLEVFFRIHASSLKYVMRMDKNPISSEMLQYIYNFLSETAQGPFSKFQELKVVNRFENEDNGKSKENSLKENMSETKATPSVKTSQKKGNDEREIFLVAIDILDNLVTQVSKNLSPSICPSTASTKALKSSGQMEVRSDVKKDVKDVKSNESKTAINKFDIVRLCIKAIKQCLLRFPQHYKSFYRLAHYYMNTSSQTKLQWSCDFLICTSVGAKMPHMVCPGLFSERKNTNFFNGIWRIPVDELDRPGSFAWHMYRSVSILHEIAKRLKDMQFLYHLSCQLHRTPDFGKKYLRDIDRTYLADQVYVGCVEMLRTQLDSLMQEEPPPSEERILTCLLDIYKAWQALHKNVPDPDHINDLLEEAYTMYKLGEVDSSPPVVRASNIILSNSSNTKRILQQQKALIQKQNMIKHTLLSAGVQPCINTGLGNEGVPSTSDSSTSVFPVEDLQQLGTPLSLPNQPWSNVSQDSLPSLSVNALQCYGSVLSNYEQFVQKDLQIEAKSFKHFVTDTKNCTKVIKSPKTPGCYKPSTKLCVVSSTQNAVTINECKSNIPTSVIKTVQIYPQPKQAIQIIPASSENNSNSGAPVISTSNLNSEMILFPIKPRQTSEQSEKHMECQNLTDSSVSTLQNQCIKKDAFSLTNNLQHTSEVFPSYLDVMKTSYAFQQQQIQQRQMLQLLANPEVSSESMLIEKDSS